MLDWLGETVRVLGLSVARLWWVALVGILASAAIKTYKLDKRLRAIIGRLGGWSIPLAVGAGLVSPLCSCGILPVVIGMLAVPVPFPAVMALLITSPLMSPEAFAITYGLLGPGYAWGKLIAAAGIGLAAGFLARFLWPGPIPFSPRWKRTPFQTGNHCVDPEDPGDPRRGLNLPSRKVTYFTMMVQEIGGPMIRLLALALIIEAVLETSIPQSWVSSLVGSSRPLAVPLAALAGIPIPLHQVAAVPIIFGLLKRAMGSGAAMALLISGPVTSIPAIFLLSRLMDRRALFLYLAVGLGGAVVAGYGFILLGG